MKPTAISQLKTVLVTGAAGGMGRAVVRLLADNGYTVYAADRVLCEEGERIIPLQADLTSEAEVSRLCESLRVKGQKLRGIIHLAGMYTLDSLVEITPEEFERIFRVNLGIAFLVNRTFLPLLPRGSRILFVTSELAVRGPLPFTGLYAVTKAALDRYAYSLRMELQLLGIDVAVLRAGAVDTGMLDVSTRSLERFTENTEHYACNADRFRRIVNSVEARRIPPKKLAEKLLKMFRQKRLRFAHSINRNPLLVMFDLLPQGLRFRIIRRVLEGKS